LSKKYGVRLLTRQPPNPDPSVAKLHAQVRIVTDEFTSKTCDKCGKCGALNPKLGGSKTFKCTHCKTVVERDSNGVCNVLLKHLTVGSTSH
jgi:transposase